MPGTDPPQDSRPPIQIEIMGRILTDIRTSTVTAMEILSAAPAVAAKYAAELTSRPGPAATPGCGG